MKKRFAFLSLFGVMSLLVVGCDHSTTAWEDVKTAARYFNRGMHSIWGRTYEDPVLASSEDFDELSDEEFIPLDDKQLKAGFVSSDVGIGQSNMQPGTQGIPYLERFKEPSAALLSVFQRMHFDTDDHVVRNKQELFAIQKIAAFMKKNPNLYLCVEGHCDQRASAAYNMALGTRRANHVRVLLIKNGVDFNRIYPVSYGKERLLAQGNDANSLFQNRRVQFKIFEKK